mgnify:CR=1 FL=1
MLDYQHIKKLAADAGFDLCGLAPCGHMAQNEAWLRAWLGKGYQSSLTYMERNVEKRADPRKLVEGARTAVVCAVSYKNRIGEGYPPGHRTKIASYACTADYHTTIKGMLNGMLEHLKAADPGLGGRAFVDTAPLLEKQLAVEAGLGWIGRQSLLVTPRHGTYVLLGELLLTDEADAYDAPQLLNFYCSTCCPIGRQNVKPCALQEFDRVMMQALAALQGADKVSAAIISIARDGRVDPGEDVQMGEILAYMKNVASTAEAMQL